MEHGLSKDNLKTKLHAQNREGETIYLYIYIGKERETEKDNKGGRKTKREGEEIFARDRII